MARPIPKTVAARSPAPFMLHVPITNNTRAKAIKKLSEGEYNELDIANFIYILGERYEYIKFPSNVKTDKEKHDYLQSLALLLGKVLDDGLYQYTEALVNNEIVLGSQTAVPYSYQFMGKRTEGKNIAEEIARLSNTQKENIINQDKAAQQATAKKYYELYLSLDKMNLSDEDRLYILEQFIVSNPLFTGLLLEDQAAKLDAVQGERAPLKDLIFQKAVNFFKINIDEKLQGELEKNKTKPSEAYVAEDAQIANKLPAAGNSSSSGNKVVEEGGKKPNNSSGTQAQINVPTTSVEKETFVVPVTEGNVKVTDSEGENFVVEVTGSGQYEEEEKGGVVVSEVDLINGRDIISEVYNYSDAQAAELADRAYYKDLYGGIRK